MRLEGSLQETPIFALIEQIDSAETSCVLHIEDEAGSRRLVFVDGDLHLSGHHPLAAALRKLLSPDGPATDDAQAKALLGKLVQRIAERLGQFRSGTYRIEEGTGGEEVVGPIPTRLLVIEGLVAQADPEAMLRSLGGETATIFARDGGSGDAALLELEPDLKELVGRLEAPVQVGELLSASPAPREELVRQLAKLRVAGLVVSLPAEAPRSPKPTERPDAESRSKSDPLVSRLQARIGRSLAARPLDVDPRRQRQELAHLIAELGNLDHYQLLGLDAMADERAVHEAYEGIARRAHPDNAQRLGWERREGVLKLLFERLTEAYRVLSDPDLRARYHREVGISVEIQQTPEERQEEVDAVARTHFERAKELVGREEFFQACELLKQAIQIAPKAEYYSMLGSIQSRNPKWVRDAQESYRRALDLDPESIEDRLALARLFERSGEVERAKTYYRAISARDPGDPAARAALRRLSKYGSARVKSDGGGGLLAWFRGLFGG